jgi:two-component system CAI-1 autoinducer sensor kinase/phosphatase CqsS
MPAAIEALHSLVGMSGEAGAAALYRSSRQTYVSMLERRQWPPEAGWAGRIADLTQRTNLELQGWIDTNRARALE